jgi:flagellar protein FliO/FliZ
MARFRFPFAATILAVSGTASAALDGTRQAYVPPPPAVSSGSIVQIIFSLLLVLAAIVLVAWLLKRMNLAQQGTAGHLKVIGGVAIGQRERVVLVEIDDTWLVVGVGPGQIRTLHTLEKPAGVASDTMGEPSLSTDHKFAALLSSVISRRPSGRKPDAP